MRSLCILLSFISLLLTTPVAAQHGDTTNTNRDSLRQEIRQSVTSEFQRWQDSVQAERIKKDVARNGKPLDEFLQEMHDREQAQKRQWWFRIGLGVLFLIVLAVGLARRRKRS